MTTVKTKGMKFVKPKPIVNTKPNVKTLKAKAKTEAKAYVKTMAKPKPSLTERQVSYRRKYNTLKKKGLNAKGKKIRKPLLAIPLKAKEEKRRKIAHYLKDTDLSYGTISKKLHCSDRTISEVNGKLAIRSQSVGRPVILKGMKIKKKNK